MRLVYKHENRGLVYSVKNLLSMQEIDCMVKNDFGNTMGAEFGIGNTLLELWVIDDAEYPRAREIIEIEMNQPVSGNAWTCPNCGEEIGGQFAICWNCQHEYEE